MVLFKNKEKIKIINNKMAINSYLSTIKSKKQIKQTRRPEIESWILESILMVAMGEWAKR